MRDLGTEGAGYADVSMKRAIDEGLIPGPRLFVATRAIVATASYGPGPRGFRPDIELPGGAQEVSGVDAAMAAVREQAARGADWIKIYGDYRVGPEGSTAPTFTPAELKALVDTAHQIGRPVAVHAASDAGVRMAVRGRRGQRRTRLRRQRGDLQADEAARHRLRAHAYRGRRDRRVFPALRAGQERTDARACARPSARSAPR